ncbi:Disease resistance protein L6 [Linum grandiflorum]
MWSGEGTTVSNASSESQTSTAELQSVVSALEYEVFLSFRGPDVRKSFADFLYSYLVRSKIRTFRDEEELQKGETIAPSLIQAIEESKIYIPILSESYASSKWCLQELAKMVECCRKGKGHIILPVFYFMDPRDVRHQAGPYEDAFEKHSKKHDPGTVQEWRTALQEVGQMKGWHVTEIHGQGAVIDGIFSKVELHLRSNYTLVTRELVGIDSHVQEVMKLLNLDSRDEKIVGIQGIGGMGKTTVAKAVYDNICTSFSRCCFLENVRELLSKNDGIVALQNKLISSILRVDFQVKEASEDLGRAIVIEEDVENPSKRSRIWSSEDAINMLKYAQGTDRVEMLRVDMRDDSNLILTAKTFEKMAGLSALRTDFNLKKVVILVLQHCYVTSYWGGWSEVQIKTSTSVWKAQEIVLPTDVKRLTISSPKVSNLLELKELEELRFMECDAAPVIPGGIWQLTKLKTLELYKCKRNGSLLADEEGTLPSSLNTLNIHGRFFRYRLPNLANLNGLTELRLTNVWITEIRGLGELRMLEVLVILSSALYNLCGLENLVNLKELTLQNCRRLESLPSLSTLVKLHSIEITKCRVLSKIQGLERLTSLKSLVMLSCLSLRRFPDLSGLKDLERLIVGSCNQLVDVVGLDKLEELRGLNMCGCESIKKLPDMSRLKNLMYLNLKGCIHLKDVKGLEKLKNLGYMEMEKRLKVKHYLKSATSYGKQYGKQLARSVQNRLKN